MQDAKPPFLLTAGTQIFTKEAELLLQVERGKCAQIYFHLPDKLMTDGAEGRLWKEGGCELVTLDIMDFGLFDGSPALMQGEKAFGLTVS